MLHPNFEPMHPRGVGICILKRDNPNCSKKAKPEEKSSVYNIKSKKTTSTNDSNLFEKTKCEHPLSFGEFLIFLTGA
jgi:hypothetical protein